MCQRAFELGGKTFHDMGYMAAIGIGTFEDVAAGISTGPA
jgi:hypothetical protein